MTPGAEALPVLLVVDGDDAVRAEAEHVLREEFGSEFDIRAARGTADAIGILDALRRDEQPLALVLLEDGAVTRAAASDDGASSLVERVRELSPDAGCVVYSDRGDTAGPAAAGPADAYLPTPWEAPDITLFPVLRDLLSRWQDRTRPVPSVVRVIGFQWSPHAHEVKDFLARNRVPYTWDDIDRDAEGRAVIERLGVPFRQLPLVLFPDGSHLLQPTDAAIAERIGLSTEAESPFYDLIIVGAGPAGLAAAVYGASEGLRTLIVDQDAPGGQAGQSARIENYLGFPEGLSGNELAQRAVAQAKKFGVEILAARRVTGLRAEGPIRVVTLDDGEEIACHTVLLALGVAWRTLDAPGCQSLVGAGVYYGAASAEAQAFREQDVYLLGGGNSAGQAALLLSRYARSVTMLALEESLAERMSEYLLHRIEDTPNIQVRPCCTVDQATGERSLETITIRNVQTEECETVPARGLFVFIGAAPQTEWLEGVVERDEQGYVLCGERLARERERPRGSAPGRAPFMLETSLPGVFVAGDVRADSVKRVAAAVGEGSVAIQFIHQYLRER
jgi:thioredoxin reductase (NADPH)